MSPLTTSSLLLVLMPSSKISSTSSPLGSERDAVKLSKHIFRSFEKSVIVCQSSVMLLSWINVWSSPVLCVVWSSTTFIQPIKVLLICNFMQINVYIGLALLPVSETTGLHAVTASEMPQLRESLILTQSPKYPFEQVCADYFHIIYFSYLTVLDRFSRWTCFYSFKVNKVNHATLQNIFRDLFVAFGVSEKLSSDGGPQFMSKSFLKFLKVWEVKHRLLSATFPIPLAEQK